MCSCLAVTKTKEKDDELRKIKIWCCCCFLWCHFREEKVKVARMRGGTVAPQNTFLDSILRRSNELDITFLIGNAGLVNHPIIYTSDNFTNATGYTKQDVLHKDCACNFLFGALTCKETVKQIRATIHAKASVQTELILYKKDQSPCWFLFQISPIKNDEDDVILYLITFKDISHLKDPIEEPTVKKWSRLVEKSLQKHKVEFQKSTNNAKSVFLQLAKKDAAKKQKLAQLISASSMNVQYSWEGSSKVSRFVIIHYGLFKTIWDWVILVLTLYTAVVAPFVVSFQYHQLGMTIVNLMVDIIFIVDVIMNFRTTYANKENEIIFNPKMICMNYLRSWFAIDFFAALPYGIPSLIYSDGWIEIINVIKVVRLIRLARIARKLDHYFEFGATTLVLWLFIFSLVAHWMACIWYVISFYFDKPSTQFSWVRLLADTTQQPYVFLNGSSMPVKGSGPTTASLYMSSLYYCMSSLTTCGFGNIAPNTTAEKLFGCITMLLGCFLYAFIFGQVTAIIQQLQLPSSIYHQKLNNIRRFIKLYSVPHDVGARLIDYFMTTWTRNKGLEIEEVLNLFPRDLRADVSVQIHKPVFESMPEFRTAPTPALRSISSYFRTLRTAPGDRVIQQGEVVDSLYILAQGSMEIRRKGQIVGILGPGDVVGSNIRLKRGTQERSFYDIYALTYSDIHFIHIDRLLEGLSLYPEFYRRFQRKLVYSFEVGQDLEVLDKDSGKSKDQGETSFIQRKNSSESSSTTSSQEHQTTMVEGEQSQSDDQVISLDKPPKTTRSKAVLLGDDGSEVNTLADVLEELGSLKDDFKTTLSAINSKLHRTNEMMLRIQKRLDDNLPGSAAQRTRTEPQSRPANTSNSNSSTATEQQRTERTITEQQRTGQQQRAEQQRTGQQRSAQQRSEQQRTAQQRSEQQRTGEQRPEQQRTGQQRGANNNDPMDDDKFVRQYKPPSNRGSMRKPNKPAVNLNDDLDEMEKVIEELELTERHSSKTMPNRKK